MAKNALFELEEAGTSVWLDYIRRSLMASGELQRMIDDDAVVGMTSNPTIFEKAIGGSSDYDEALRKLVEQGLSDEEIFLSIMVEDIQMAADVLKPVYDTTKHKDGYVSIEVLPKVANDTKGTVTMAHQLWDRVGRPNVMVKIPATTEGLPAIEQCIADGININITLMFSVKVYEDVARAYIRGLQRRMRAGNPVDIASVASFFVSRVDTAVDKLLEAKIAAARDPAERTRLQNLLGKAAVANAKMAYKAFGRIFNEPEFADLRAKGATVQRCLWASTGTKNPHYSDVLYVEELIGPDTVNTMPQQTMMAFKEHGEVRPSLLENVNGAEQVMRDLAAVGIDMETVTYDLQIDGIKLFADSITKLMEGLAKKKQELKGGNAGAHEATLGALEGPVGARLKQLEQDAVVRRIGEKDASLWSSNASAQPEIRDRLGWLQVADRMEERIPDLIGLKKELLAEGFTQALLMGMGGSSLAPEVFRTTFGAVKGALDLHVLDTTDPAAIRAVERDLDLAKTVFIVSSKSGTTLETLSHYRYFWKQAGGKGRQFLAITDPGSQLAEEAKTKGFRRTFLNPADIGGRYSALSYFGMVPAAISGVDVETLLDRAVHAAHIAANPAAEANPPAMLGLVIGTMAGQKRDKLTLITPAPLDTLGLWIEQLVAESTGKEGKGIVPIAGEPLGTPSQYGNDRLFVAVHLRSSDVRSSIDSLVAAGQPVVDLVLEDPLDLGETFFLWEFAVAVAGSLMGIDAFDQPNVQESKDNTKRILEEYKSNGSLPKQAAVGAPGKVTIFSSGGSRGPAGSSNPNDTLATLLSMVTPGDYVALTEYFAQTPKRDELLAEIRAEISQNLRVATTTGYGPRFLHSTGQLHKGGSDAGVFIQLTSDDAQDVPIPGEKFGFSVLKQSQALGDFQSLASRGRRAIRIDLGRDIDGGLQWLLETVKESVGSRVGAAR